MRIDEIGFPNKKKNSINFVISINSFNSINFEIIYKFPKLTKKNRISEIIKFREIENFNIRQFIKLSKFQKFIIW